MQFADRLDNEIAGAITEHAFEEVIAIVAHRLGACLQVSTDKDRLFAVITKVIREKAELD